MDSKAFSMTSKKSDDASQGTPGDEQDGGSQPTQCPVVGIGASAGGLDAFKAFLEHTPVDSGSAFVLIQHLSPNHPSMLASILSNSTDMPVVEATDGMAVEPDHVYVIPQKTTLTIEHGRLHITAPAAAHGQRAPIDNFFLSLAADQGENAACIVLSGAGSDGTVGLKAVKANGGLTIAQTAETAAHDSMLQSAVRTGLVDVQLPVEEMPGKLVEYFRHLSDITPQKGDDGLVQVGASSLHAVSAILLSRTGHDFGQYKQKTLIRRLQRRMQVHQIKNVSDYIALLRRDKNEPNLLFKDLLIGVTNFFRDREAFEALADKVIPELARDRRPEDKIRIWVPGCATGEEAYSLAILLSECLAAWEVKPKIQIFASDIDEDALQVARIGQYPRAIENDVSPERLNRWFTREDGGYRIRPSLREACIFAAHNLLRDPPFSRLDLISCRNLLIYLNADLQVQLIPVLHYALRPGGYLFLGPSENVTQHAGLFRPIDKKHRIFKRREDGLKTLPKFPITDFTPPSPHSTTPRPPVQRQHGVGLGERTERLVLDRYAPAYVLVNQDYVILESSKRTGKYLELGSGTPDLNVLTMARPELRLELRAALNKAMQDQARIVRRDIVLNANGGPQVVTLAIEPIKDREAGQTFYLILFRDTAPPKPEGNGGTGEDERSVEHDNIESLERELRRTRDHLQTTTEELETSNEELKSSNEEMSSVNEELQSANEELETSKEELQSINEELQTVNVELNNRVDDLSRANADLKNLLESTQIATVFLDKALLIRNFTPPAREVFHLREADFGRPITEIASKLARPDLAEEIRQVLRTLEPVEHEVSTASGDRTYIMRILLYQNMEEDVEGVVLTFLDITQRKRQEEHQKMLVAELSHRVKNTLATVQSIAAQTADRTRSVGDFRETFNGRIKALANAHSLLTRSNWEGVCLNDLVEATLKPYRIGERANVAVRGDRIMLNAKAAVTLSLILHELTTNAAKYGALACSGGKVEIAWSVEDSNDRRVLRLVWQESGVPRVEPPGAPGFGLTLIRRSVGYELDGEAAIDFPPNGLRCEIVAPCDRVIFS